MGCCFEVLWIMIVWLSLFFEGFKEVLRECTIRATLEVMLHKVEILKVFIVIIAYRYKQSCRVLIVDLLF